MGEGSNLRLRLAGDWESNPLAGLCEVGRVGLAVEKLQLELVGQARNAGASWTDIGAALGVSKQAAWQRFATPED